MTQPHTGSRWHTMRRLPVAAYRDRMLRAVLIAALASIGAAVPAASGAVDPRISINPTSGPPGSQITVTGTGFCQSTPSGPPSGCSTVVIRIYGVPVATDITVMDGAFTVQAKIPGGPSGGDIGVIAVQELADESESQAFAQFVVLIHDPNPSGPVPGPSTPVPPGQPPEQTNTVPPTASTGSGTTGDTAQTPQAAPTSSDGGGGRLWIWLSALAAVALAGTGGAIVVRRRLAKGPNSPTSP